MNPNEPSGAQATCPAHPNFVAASICTRCGRYLCTVCSEGGRQEMCADCRRLTGAASFPLRRDDWDFSRLLSHVWSAFAREWLMLSVAVLIMLGVSWAIGMALQLFVGLAGGMVGVVAGNDIGEPGGPSAGIAIGAAMFVIVLAQYAAIGVLMLGLFAMMGDVLVGGKVELGRLFGQIGKVGRVLLLFLLIGLLALIPAGLLAGVVALTGSGEVELGVGIALGVVVGLLVFWALLPTSLALFEMAWDDEVGALGAIRRAYALARGHYLALLGASVLAGIFALAGTMALCIGYFPGVALGYLLMFGLYLTLRNGSEVAREAGMGAG